MWSGEVNGGVVIEEVLKHGRAAFAFALFTCTIATITMRSLGEKII